MGKIARSGDSGAFSAGDGRRLTRSELIGLAGVVATFLVFLASTYWGEIRGTKVLSVSYSGAWSPLICAGIEEGLEIVFDGVPGRNVHITLFSVENDGYSNITLDDFVEDIRVSRRDSVKILGVLEPSGTDGMVWSLTQEGLAIRPTFLAPNAPRILAIATEEEQQCVDPNMPASQWDWSIKLKTGTGNLRGFDGSLHPVVREVSSVDVHLSGWYVWLALAGSAGFFFCSISLLSTLSWRFAKRWSLIIPVFCASVANGQNMAFVLDAGWSNLWWVAKAHLVFHLLLICGVVVHYLATRLKSPSGASGNPVEASASARLQSSSESAKRNRKGRRGKS